MTNENPFALLHSGAWIYGFQEDLLHLLQRCEELCFTLNALPPSQQAKRSEVIRQIFGSIGRECILHSPFHCDFGTHIHIGDHFVGNFHLTILDEAPVTIGNHVFIGPNTTLCTVVHAFQADQRDEGVMRALPISIGNHVWIASNVVILPGVTIGDGAIIGAGSVVTKDIPSNVLAVGNPCRVIRPLTEADRVQVVG